MSHSFDEFWIGLEGSAIECKPDTKPEKLAMELFRREKETIPTHKDRDWSIDKLIKFGFNMSEEPVLLDEISEFAAAAIGLKKAVFHAGVKAERSNGEYTKTKKSKKRQTSSGHIAAQGPDFQMSDYGNAERLVHGHGENLRYCPPFGKWFYWDGTRWQTDETGDIIRRAKASVRGIHAEADRIKVSESSNQAERKALGELRENICKHAVRSEEAHELRAMVELAQTEPGIPVMPNDLDSDPFSLCVPNGVIDLRTGTLKPHSREDLITKLAPVAFDPEATCPRWNAFLLEVFHGDVEIVSYIQRAVGYSLTADVREQVLFFLYGTGANGKSTLMAIITAIAGSYAQRAPQSLVISDGRDAKIPIDVARLKGARLVSCSELEEGKPMAEATVKDLTGGDRLVARYMRENFFEFAPTHKLWMIGNHRPSIRGTDDGVWRRIQLIPLTVKFEDSQKDPDLPNKLAKELPGVLAWAVRGCLEWQRIGLKPPAIVKAAIQEYRQAEDKIAQFIDEVCTTSSDCWIASKRLYEAFVEWSKSAGDFRPLSSKILTNRLRGKGFVPDKKNHTRGWAGLCLKD